MPESPVCGQGYGKFVDGVVSVCAGGIGPLSAVPNARRCLVVDVFAQRVGGEVVEDK
jgi:hypothetical protein